MNRVSKDQIIKDKILQSAENLYIKWGFKKTSMEDIAKASGKAKSTLYYYYKSKNEIFEELFNTSSAEIINVALAESNKYKTEADKFLHYITESFKEMKRRVNVYGIIVTELKHENQLLESVLSIFDKKEQKILEKIYLKGMKNGEFKKISKADVTLLAEQIIMTVRHLEIDTFVNQNAKIDERRISLLADLILNGIKK